MTEVLEGTLDRMGLRLLTRVDGNLDAGTYAAIEPYEADEPYFPDYVDTDFPRNQEVTEGVVEQALGYAIADENGNIIARFEGEKNGLTALQRATRARDGAKVTLNVDIDNIEGDEIETTGDESDD